MRIRDFMSKMVVSINDGRELGLVEDMEIESCTGKIQCIFVSDSCFSKKTSANRIPWADICKIGDDVILVNLTNCFKRC